MSHKNINNNLFSNILNVGVSVYSGSVHFFPGTQKNSQQVVVVGVVTSTVSDEIIQISELLKPFQVRFLRTSFSGGLFYKQSAIANSSAETRGLVAICDMVDIL